MYVLAKRKISNGQFTKVSTISFKVTQFFDIQVVDGAQTTFSKH
jgi:hypothetical protein